MKFLKEQFKWFLTMIHWTSKFHHQLSLACTQNFSHLHSLCVGILFNSVALGILLQLFRERSSGKVCTRQSRQVIWRYDQCTVPDTVAVELTLLLSFSTSKHMSMASRAIFSNFCEEQRTQNHPKYLSGLSRALFPTTFLEIAVYNTSQLYHFQARLGSEICSSDLNILT